ncbi:MAG: Sau3AI family type II restriction endonuclease [Chthoniobacteraceae bacterium]|nr:Sau3AI family type II restriction endonuclease [Chthoniobacteraceae bacterium]
MRHARKLEGRTLREAINVLVPPKELGVVMEEAAKYCTGKAKGKFGNAIEAGHFYYKPNSDKEPDLGWAELKCTGLKRVKSGRSTKLSAKERLVICMINFGGGDQEEEKSILKETFDTSHAKKKLNSLVLVFYEYAKGTAVLDLKVLLVDHWMPDATELRMIREDWELIKSYVKAGDAHLISESLTNILGACTKGAKGTDRVKQANNKEKAKPRAFALKQAFVTQIYERLLNQRSGGKAPEPEIHLDGMDLYRKAKDRFEDFVTKRLNKYAGKTTVQICDELGITGKFESKDKHARRMRKFLNKILSGSQDQESDNLAEFKNTGLQIKTVRLKANGMPAEAVSFPHFKYDELADEDDWEDSELYGMLTSRFLFIFLREMGEGKDPVFEKAIFHSLSEDDLDEAEKAWKLAVEKARERVYEEMPGQKANRVIHVRPHDSKARYGKDPSVEKHRCFWLNQRYIRGVI